jgi:cytochrome b561
VTRFIHPLTLLAVIAVPVAGWFGDNWSGGTTLAVYWFETIATCLFIAAQTLVHQRWNPRRGHFRYAAPSGARGSAQASFVKGFLVTSLTFSAAHAVFLGAMLFLLNHNGESELAAVDWRSVGFGCLSVFTLLAIDFLVDLLTLRQRSFWQIEQTANRGLSRVAVVHLTLVFGLFGVAMTGAPTALFGVFVVLKSLFALSTVLPRWEPAVAPKWLSRVMNRVPNVHRGKSFEEVWAKDRADETARCARNDQPWAGAQS